MRRSVSFQVASVALALLGLSACDSHGDGDGDASAAEDGSVDNDASTSGDGDGDGDITGDGDGDGDTTGDGDGDGDGDAAVIGDGDGGTGSSIDSELEGEKDTTFGTNGVLTTALDQRDILGWRLVGEDIYLVTSDRVPTPAGPTDGYGVTRWDYEGNQDTAYGEDGMLLTIQGQPPYAIDAMGRVYTTGTALLPNGFSLAGLMITRYDATGHLDTTYGTGGQLAFNPSNLSGYTGTYIQSSAAMGLPDGGFLLVGYVQDAMGEGPVPTRQWFVAKLNDDGSLDPEFGDEGGYTLIMRGTNDAVDQIFLAQDGTIYLSSRLTDVSRTRVIAKLSADGTHDTEYGEEGYATIAIGETTIVRFIADAEGRVIGVGSYPGNGPSMQAAYVTRLDADGALDTSFGTAGEVTLDFVTLPHDSATWTDVFGDVWLEGDAIVAAGHTSSVRGDHYVLARLHEDGAFDTGFPYIEALGHTYDVSFNLSAMNGAVPTDPAVLPTPDGTAAIGFGPCDGKMCVVRWE